jgi:xanthine dehydrogenase YagT iron-sulfur-binding subunit
MPFGDGFASVADSSYPGGLKRRDVLRTTTLGAAAASAMLTPDWAADAKQPAAVDAAAPLGDGVSIDLVVNGRRNRITVDTRTTLLDALRNGLGLTGSKKGCDHGQCGACTVQVGGKRTLSCLTLAVMVREPVTTIEGVGDADGTLHPMQQAFIDQDAFQCGFCTPGQILSAICCVNEGHVGSSDEIREYMSGNLCRCAAYPHIVAAIEQAAPKMKA